MVDLYFPQVPRFPSSLSFETGHTSWNRGLVFCLEIEQQRLAQLPWPHDQVLPSRVHQNQGQTSLTLLGPFKAGLIVFR